MSRGSAPASTVEPEPDDGPGPAAVTERLGRHAVEADDDAVPKRCLADLAVRASDGDVRATEELLRVVRALVHRYCRARLGSLPGAHHAADDAAQEVCVAVLSALPRYRHEGRPFEAFVYRIASRRVADTMRAAYREAVPVEEVPDPVDGDPTPEDVAVRTAEAQRARYLLDQLTDQQREILTLRVAVGLSGAETASALGISPGAVRVAQHRALARLRALTVPAAGWRSTAVPALTSALDVGGEHSRTRLALVLGGRQPPASHQEGNRRD